jgi:DNA-binding transcriptional LysR family regulator
MIPVIARSRVPKDFALTMTWLTSQPQIIVAASGDICDSEKREALGLLKGGKRCFVTDHSLKRRMIEDGFGWGRLAHHEAAAGLQSGQLQSIPSHLAAGFTLDLHVMRSRTRPMGPIARSVWAKLQSLSQTLNPR